MLLSNIDPILTEWINLFLPLFSGIAKVLVLGTMLVLMRMTYNTLSRLITHIAGI